MKSDLAQIVNQFYGKKIVVVGDMVADVYLHGNISRISREAPVLVLEHAAERVVPGGAGNVVHNIATLGGKVWAAGLVGSDEAGKGLKEIFIAKNVDVTGLIVAKGRPTITKTRIVAGGAATVSQQIVRIDKETRMPISAHDEAILVKYIAEVLPVADGVVMSDYGSGTLTEGIIKQIIALAKAEGIPCMVDSRYNLLAFKGVDYVKQNDAEASAFVGFTINDKKSLGEAGAILLEKMAAKGILITQGDKGMTLFEADGSIHTISVANRSEVFDVSGAGDTCVSAMILALAAGAAPAQAAAVSNFAAGIAVRKLGTATVNADELKQVIGAI